MPYLELTIFPSIFAGLNHSVSCTTFSMVMGLHNVIPITVTGFIYLAESSNMAAILKLSTTLVLAIILVAGMQCEPVPHRSKRDSCKDVIFLHFLRLQFSPYWQDMRGKDCNAFAVWQSLCHDFTLFIPYPLRPYTID